MLGDSAYDILDWHDLLLDAAAVPVASYNPCNTTGSKDIEYRVEDRVEEHGEDAQLKQFILDKTYDWRTGVKRTHDACKDCGLGHVHARTEVFVALCRRIVIGTRSYPVSQRVCTGAPQSSLDEVIGLGITVRVVRFHYSGSYLKLTQESGYHTCV